MFTKLSIIAVFLLAVFLLFFKLGSHPLELWDEQTNAAVVQDTLASGNPLILQYQGKDFLEKPPLWYYLTMVFVKVFGQGNEILRLPSALYSLVTFSLVFFLGRKFFGIKAGIVAALALLAVGQLFINNPAGEGLFFSTHTLRSADLDALQIMLLMLSLWFAVRVKNNVKNFYLTAAVLALAFLTKGPLVILPAAFYLVYFYRRREIYSLQFRNFLLAGIIFCGILLPWHILMLIHSGQEFVGGYLGYHLLGRLTMPLEGHSADALFYLRVAGNFAFFSFWPLALLAIMRKFLAKTSTLLLDFNVFMISGTILIFTLVQTKLAWYILPIYPFAAILAGYLLHNFEAEKRKLLQILILLILAIGVALNLRYIFLM